MIEKWLVLGISERDVRHLDDGWRQLFDVREAEVNDVLRLGWFEDWHLFQLLDSGLRLRRLGSIVSKLVNKCLQMGTLCHLVFIFAFGVLPPLFLCCIEGIEVGSLVVVQSLRVLMDNISCHLIEKSTV